MNLNLNIPAASSENAAGGWRIEPEFLRQVKTRLTENVVDFETIEEILLVLQSLSGSSLVWHTLSDGRMMAQCTKCALKVDANGKPDRRFYSDEWIINFLSDPRGKCDHRRAPSVVVNSHTFHYDQLPARTPDPEPDYNGPEVQDNFIGLIRTIFHRTKKVVDKDFGL